MILTKTTEWLAGRPKWLQYASKRLLETGKLNENAISELTELCRKEATNDFPDIDYSLPANAFDTQDSEKISLSSIGDVSGINKLAPRKPLEFGADNITVIYGHNGSGKSGYVRLLKHVCGARDCIKGSLHKNVFSDEDVSQSAKISFRKGGAVIDHEWPTQGVSDDLSSVDIFDTSFGRVFMGGEDEVCYEPPVLSFFSRLIGVCEKVSDKLDTEAGALKSKMPSMPSSLEGSIFANWLELLKKDTPAEEIDNNCSFTAENEKELQNIQKRLAEESPAEKAKQLRTKKAHADALDKGLQRYIDQLSDEVCKKIIATANDASLKKSAAEAAAKDAFSGAALEGIGSDVWKELWVAARKFSVEAAYIGQEFPVVLADSICVLCNQPLTDDAKQRFRSFETHVKGETQKQAIQAERDVTQAIDALPDIPSTEVLKLKVDAAGIDDQELITGLNAVICALQERRTKLPSFKSETGLKAIPLVQPWLDKIREISRGYEESALKYLEDAEKDNRDELQKVLKNLQARKWCSEQKSAIEDEVIRLQGLEDIQRAKKKTSSTALSKKKGELAKALITDSFVQRFNSELKDLGASKLRVKLIKSRVAKGKVLHTLQLDGASHRSLNEVLSEGENRIVSIAAFMADVTGRNHPAPFVFDDPISSLDQDFEEAVVQRLCSIASERQVIVFTHRLSLLGMLQDYAKKESIGTDVICIREESWGTGEPGDTPLFAKKPDKALNKLIDNRLSKAKKLFDDHGKEVYDPYAKALCSDFRILLERMVECELTADVIQRYRRAINTMGKIGNLAKIKEVDCTYFDEMMTKYSRYEHSQPVEAPVQLPDPDELAADFKKLKEWHTEFKSRPLSPVS